MSDYEEYGARRLEKIIKENIEANIIEEALTNKSNIYISELSHLQTKI